MNHAERLTGAAGELARLRAQADGDEAIGGWRLAVRQWQAERLARTHADLLANGRYRDAARFFLDDLYGVKDFSRRDAELSRVIPTLTRTLPDQALATLADAVELEAMTARLDDALARELHAAGPEAIDEVAYARAYRGAAPIGQRAHQLDLVVEIGHSLDRLVRHPFLGTLLSAMSGPAP